MIVVVVELPFLSNAVIVTVLSPTGPVGVPVIFPSVNVNPFGKPSTTIGLSSRKPTPPGLSSAVTKIGLIGSFFVTVAPSAVIVGPSVSGTEASRTVTGTRTSSLDPSGYVTVTTASSAFPTTAVVGLLLTVR